MGAFHGVERGASVDDDILLPPYTNNGANILHRHYHNIADGVFKSRKIAVYMCFTWGIPKWWGFRKLV